jgi:hypothetical protein
MPGHPTGGPAHLGGHHADETGAAQRCGPHGTLLGLNPSGLQAVRIEHAKVLPGIRLSRGHP